MPNAGIDGHFDERDIAAYVDGGVSADGRALMDAHLSVCAACRGEVVEVSRILRTAPHVGRLLRHLWGKPLLS